MPTFYATLVVLLLSFLFGSYFVNGCYPNINSNGITYPRGDIDLRAGSDLILNCTLNDNYFGPSNASDIGWKYNDTPIPSSYIRVLDRRTAQLHIANVNISDTGKYSCILRSSKTSLCLNVVTVGTPPPKINDSNFRCISEEWINLTCRWDVPENPIRTTWALHYRIPQGNVSCPLYSSSNGVHECFFNDSTQPSYRRAAPYFYFVVTGNNSYGTSVSQFKVDHFQNVIPSPPKEFSVMSYGNTGLRITWTLQSLFTVFPVPLVYRLKYRSQWDALDEWKSVEIKNRTLYILENLIPYTNYTLSVQCRSERAPDIKMMWSKSVERTHSTLPEIPNSPLLTAPGGFDDVNIDMDRRNITIYWKALSKMEQYGPDFKYVVNVYENSIFNGNIVPTVETLLYAKFYALFKNRSYSFKIKASNSVGMSNYEGMVFVERSTNRPAPLEGFSVLYYYKGIYGLSWYRPIGNTQIMNYTAFWCKSHRQMLDPCSASLNWQFVDGNATVVNITVSDNLSNYRFALSANGRTTSSGMVWAKCMALYNGVLGKVKMLPLQVIDSHRIELNWVVDCLDRTGRIRGFNISYCVFDNSTNSCKDKPKYEFVSDCTLTSYVLDNLVPYTTYSITIAPTAKSGTGEPSDALQTTTSEDAPDDAPRNIHLTSVTNHSITLSWKPPLTSNGIITYYVISYGTETHIVNVTNNNSSDITMTATLKKNIYSYTNYSIQMMGCTSKGCSKLSDPIVALTGIGVPGQPEAPTARLMNTTNAIVSWDVPSMTGGPIDHWLVLMISSDDGTEENTTSKVYGTSYIQHVSCEDMDGYEYKFAVCAVNVVNGSELVGNWSSFYVLNVCFTETLPFIFNASIMSILTVATLALTLISLLAFYVFKIGRRKFKEVQTMEVVLPKGLVEGSLGSYKGFKKNLAPIKECEIPPTSAASIAGLYGRLPSISSDAGRSSQDSGETLNMTSSLTSINDEVYKNEKKFTKLLYTDKAGQFRYSRNLSGDSSGCSSIVGSVSSSVTARTHLSSDSGTEVDFHLPRSPDMVFLESNDWLLTPVVKTPNCQIRLRNSNNPQRFGEEFDEGDIESSVDTTTLPDSKAVALRDSNTSNVHYCKVATKLATEAPLPPVFDRHNATVDLQDPSPPRSELQVYGGSVGSEINSYSRVDVTPQSKLGGGYVCIGESDAKSDVSPDLIVESNNSDTILKSKRNRKISLPIGIVTKINSSKVDTDDLKGTQVGPYVAVALVDDTPKKVSIGYSKLATSGLLPRAPLEQSKSSEGTVSRGDEQYGETNKKVNSEILSTTIRKGYITVASLDEHSDSPLREGEGPIDLKNLLSEMNNLSLESTAEGSWEKELENSEENVTEEDILSITPSNSVNSKGYVSLDGVTDSAGVSNNGESVSVVSVRGNEVDSFIQTYV